MAKEIFRLTNVERKKVGKATLQEDDTLTRVAQDHADHMAQVWNDLWAKRAKEKPDQDSFIRAAWVSAEFNKLDFHDLGRGGVGDRTRAVAPDKYNYYGENTARGLTDSDSASAVQRWMNSKGGHKEQILTDKGTRMGVGVAYTSSGYPMFVQVYARPW
jgi:uncharacterized protein YkwD